MIDDKKIETAKEEIYEDKFLGCGEMVEAFKDEDAMEMFDKKDIKETIGLGAKWMQEEFLKDLWHPASEMPDKNRTCLVRVVYHPNHGMFQDEERIEQSSFHDFGWYDYDFKYIGTNYDIISWLYISDLLTKEGGEQ